MTDRACSCGRTVHAGTHLCRACVRTLDVALTHIAEHDSDLATLRSKHTRYGSPGANTGQLGNTQPLIIDLRFVALTNAQMADDWQIPGKEGQGTALHHDTRTTLTRWTRTSLQAWPTLTPPAAHVPGMCMFLAGILTAIAGQPWSTALLADMLRLERALTRLVDRPPERWYAGKCSHQRQTGDGTTACPAELYAEADSGYITCRNCGHRHDVASRREFLLTEARHVLVTATEAAGALLAWTDYDGSETKLVDLIGKWRDRGLLEVADVTSLLGRDRHLYLLGHIQDLLVRHAQDEQDRRIRPGA